MLLLCWALSLQAHKIVEAQKTYTAYGMHPLHAVLQALHLSLSCVQVPTHAQTLTVLTHRREYNIALRIELARKQLGADNVNRGAELAAYFTHTKLQPMHQVCRPAEVK